MPPLPIVQASDGLWFRVQGPKLFEHTVKAPPKPGPLITECLALPLAGLETLCKNLLRSRQLGYVSRTILPAFTCSHQQAQNLLHLRVTSKFCSMGRARLLVFRTCLTSWFIWLSWRWNTIKLLTVSPLVQLCHVMVLVSVSYTACLCWSFVFCTLQHSV